jgi:hypothetical protein
MHCRLQMNGKFFIHFKIIIKRNKMIFMIQYSNYFEKKYASGHLVCNKLLFPNIGKVRLNTGIDILSILYITY